MVCSEYCVLILVLCSTVQHCLPIQPRIAKPFVDQKTQTSPKNTTALSKKIYENIAEPPTGRTNKSVEVPLTHSQNEIPTSAPTSTTEQPKPNMPAKFFPKQEGNGTKIVTTEKLLTKLNSSDTLLFANKPNESLAEINATTNQSVSLNQTEAVLTNNVDSVSNTTTITIIGSNSNDTNNTVNVNTNTTINKPSKVRQGQDESVDLLNFTIPIPTQSAQSVPNVIYNDSQKLDKETELIEDGQNTEDILRNPSASHADKDQVPPPGVPLVQGQLAAILAGVFVAISVIAYIGLLTWRRYLENRYGNRQMLINEEEFNDDMRHFTI